MPESPFESDVEGWILNALPLAGGTWPNLLKALPGVYPSDVLRALSRLAARASVASATRDSLDAIRAQAAGPAPTRPWQPWRTDGRPLPVPHPLDFEWRFTPESADFLVNRCETGLAPVALVGAPTPFMRAVERGAGSRYVLLDKNRATISRLLDAFPRSQVFVHDACSDAPPHDTFGTALLDPPWYDPHVRGFLWTASHAVWRGGLVMLSLPPLGTRPGIEVERASLFSWAASHLGLDLTDLERGCLSYLSPPFEWSALRAAGTGGVPPDWRCGDLATFRVRGADAPAPQRPPQPRSPDQWVELQMRGVRIRFDPRACTAPGRLSLAPVVAGDVLPTVSARDPRRGAVSVWTSGNRVYSCTDPLRLRADLISATRAANERRGMAVTGAIGQLLDVILREEEEYAAIDTDDR